MKSRKAKQFLRENSYIRMLRALRNAGWTKKSVVGSSHAAIRFSPCGKFVFRASRDGGDGWTRFIKWATKVQKSPHLPRIYRLWQLMDCKHSYTAAVIERLTEMDDLFASDHKLTNNARAGVALHGFSYGRGRLNATLRKIEKIEDEALAGLATIIKRMTKDLGKPDDLGQHNMMIRPDPVSTLVLLDPYA